VYICPKLSGPKNRGRPKMTWTEVIKKDVQELGICKENVADRARCRGMISVGPHGGLSGPF